MYLDLFKSLRIQASLELTSCSSSPGSLQTFSPSPLPPKKKILISDWTKVSTKKKTYIPSLCFNEIIEIATASFGVRYFLKVVGDEFFFSKILPWLPVKTLLLTAFQGCDYSKTVLCYKIS